MRKLARSAERAVLLTLQRVGLCAANGASPLIALFCGRCTAWLPPLTMIGTLGRSDFDGEVPDIVKSGTPDQRAVLRLRF